MKQLPIRVCALFFLFCSCGSKDEADSDIKIVKETPVQTNQYIFMYAGSYMVEVEGISSQNETEGYALKSDGTATWLWIENDGSNGAVVKSKKHGTWTAEKGKIVTSINGNSEEIVERWKENNGTFINEDSPSRYLKTQY